MLAYPYIWRYHAPRNLLVAVFVAGFSALTPPHISPALPQANVTWVLAVIMYTMTLWLDYSPASQRERDRTGSRMYPPASNVILVFASWLVGSMVVAPLRAHWELAWSQYLISNPAFGLLSALAISMVIVAVASKIVWEIAHKARVLQMVLGSQRKCAKR